MSWFQGELFPPWWVVSTAVVSQRWVVRRAIWVNCPAPGSALCTTSTIVVFFILMYYIYHILWIALLLSPLCTTSTIVVPYIIEFIQPIETTLTKMGPATMGFTWYAFFHHTVEKDFNLVLNVELKTLYLCVSERGYSTGCYYHRNGRILTIDNCCAHCQATLRFSTSDSKQP